MCSWPGEGSHRLEYIIIGVCCGVVLVLVTMAVVAWILYKTR